MENPLIVFALLLAAQVGATFDVASIRRSSPDTKPVADTHPGGVFVGRHIPVRALVGIAFGQKATVIVGEPAWFGDYYDIDAKAEGAGEMTEEELAVPMQALLRDRFALVTHEEMKQQTVYSLEREKLAPNMTRVRSDDWPMFKATSTGSEAHNETMAALALRFSRSPEINAPVVDNTGLEGSYDFVLDYTGGPVTFSTFEAARSVGLLLRQQKAMAPVLVIDQIHKPSEN